MKTRNGFVSNSSSSSFIIATPITSKGKIEIAPEAFGKVIKTKTELKEYYNSDEKDLEKDTEYLKALKYLDEGNILIYCDIEYDGIAAFTELLSKAKIKYMECEQ